jgi:hypothetical protein
VLSRTPSGHWGVVSYNSKLAKGRLAAALFRRRAAGIDITSAAEVAAAWREDTRLDATTVATNRIEVYTDAR